MAEKLYSYADKQVMDEVGSSEGGGGGYNNNLIVSENQDGIIEATWQEIYNVISAGDNVVIYMKDNNDPTHGVYDKVVNVVGVYRTAGTEVQTGYAVTAGDEEQWTTATPNGYPSRVVT